MRRRRARNVRLQCGGFTVVEAVCAGIILALSAAAIGSRVSQAVRSVSQARELRAATAVLDELMTKVDLIGPLRLDYEGPTEGVIDQRFAWEIKIEQQLEGDLYAVSLKVYWLAGGWAWDSDEGEVTEDGADMDMSLDEADGADRPMAPSGAPARVGRRMIEAHTLINDGAGYRNPLFEWDDL